MIRIGVRNVAALAVWRHHDHGDAGAVAEKIERLDIARIPVSAAFVEGDHDRRLGPKLGIGLHEVDNLFDEAFK